MFLGRQENRDLRGLRLENGQLAESTPSCPCREPCRVCFGHGIGPANAAREGALIVHGLDSMVILQKNGPNGLAVESLWHRAFGSLHELAKQS